MIKWWSSNCLKLRGKMLLCSLPSFLVKSWDLCCPCYPGRKSICWMVLKIRLFPYLPTLQMQCMFGSMLYCFHSHPVRSPECLCLFPAMSYCTAGANAVPPGGLPEPILTRRITWKVSIYLFIRFGSQLALSFVASASLKTWFCLFMFFLVVRKKFGTFQPSFGGKFSELSNQISIHMSKPASLGSYFQEETDNDFCIQQDTAWVEVMRLSHQFLFPHFFPPSLICKLIYCKLYWDCWCLLQFMLDLMEAAAPPVSPLSKPPGLHHGLSAWAPAAWISH